MLARSLRRSKISLVAITAVLMSPGALVAGPAPSQSPTALPPAAAAPATTQTPAAATQTPATASPTPAPTAAAPAAPPSPSTPPSPAATTAAPTPSNAPPAAAAAPAPAEPAPAAAAAAPPPPPTVGDSVVTALSDKGVTGNANKDDVAALDAFYKGRASLSFASELGWSSKGSAIRAELKKADDYGLEASAFPVPDFAAGGDVAAQGAAEARLALAALKYARFARGGRFDPQRTSNILDVSGEIKDPAAVIAELTSSDTPDAVLRSLNPQHKEFEALRQALLKARGPAPVEAPPVDPALLIKLPDGKKNLKTGMEHDDVALLRQRLKVPAAAGGNDKLYDAAVETAVAGFQVANGLKGTGVLNARTRQALNAEGQPKKPLDRNGEIDLIIVNMERWRWLPADLGPMYVMDNIPEFMTRVVKGDKTLFEEKIIVGQPTWPTPMLTDSIEKVVFNPAWGMPDGIKMKELLPRLRQASGGNDFFSQLFGGGGGGGRVIEAYGLKPSIDGRPIDPDSVNWNQVDIRRYSFTQPAGATNPLGRVKFMFPNKHDVYMHDTSQRPLFAQASRALSHGCIRVQNPERLAEILLAEDKGWDAEKVNDLFSGGNEIVLDNPVPVYLTYFTARVGADGKLRTFSDIYGHDSRLVSALAGRPVRYEPPEVSGKEVIADATYDSQFETSSAATGKKQKKKKGGGDPGDLISNALSGLLFN